MPLPSERSDLGGTEEPACHSQAPARWEQVKPSRTEFRGSCFLEGWQWTRFSLLTLERTCIHINGRKGNSECCQQRRPLRHYLGNFTSASGQVIEIPSHSGLCQSFFTFTVRKGAFKRPRSRAQASPSQLHQRSYQLTVHRTQSRSDSLQLLSAPL